MSKVWANFQDWLKKPFDAGMDAFHWFLFFGFLILLSVLWTLVLRHTIGSIEA